MRLTFDIDERTHQTLSRFLPHGMRAHAYRAIVEGLARQLEKNPARILHELLSYKIDYASLIRCAAEDKNKGG